MSYGAITLLSQLDATAPAGSEAANKLPDAQRQVKQFLQSFLSVSFNDDGSLKAGSVATTAVIGPNAIVHNNLTDGCVQDNNIGADAVDSPQLVEASVFGGALGSKHHIAAGSIAAVDIAAATIDATRLAQYNVSDTADAANKLILGNQIHPHSITAAQIAPSTITAAELAPGAVAAAAIGTGTITAPQLQGVASASGVRLPVVTPAAAGNVYAEVGGCLTASLSGTTIAFALASNAAGASMVAFNQQTTAGSSASLAGALSTWDVRKWTLIYGDSTLVSSNSSTGALTFKKPGVYLVFFAVPGNNGVGVHIAALVDASNNVQFYGSGAKAGAGAQTESIGFGALQVSQANTVYYVKHGCTSAVVTNGQGDVTGLPVANCGTLTVIAL
jgi:hypothetical protein